MITSVQRHSVHETTESKDLETSHACSAGRNVTAAPRGSIKFVAGSLTQQIYDNICSIFVAIVAAVYAIIFQNYRVNTSIDTQFYLAFSYNYCVKGIDTDVTFGSSFPFGMGGTIAFGKLAAIVQ
ncbi:MAG TPA: hypothetical protein VHT68_08760 [Pseudolabrys sp.]|nr:hypothetical protein [Pseudolabrys sp.]